jgi:hypothetical protein
VAPTPDRYAVQLREQEWGKVLYALDSFVAGTCGQDRVLPRQLALELGGRMRAQLQEAIPAAEGRRV